MYITEERRFTNLLCEYWNEIRGERHHPSLSQIEQEHISDIWEHCFIVKHANNSYEVIYLGDEIKEANRHALNISSDAPIIQFDDVENIRHYLDEVIESMEAVIDESECFDLEGNMIKFRYCCLPLGESDNSVDAIIGVTRYKIY